MEKFEDRKMTEPETYAVNNTNLNCSTSMGDSELIKYNETSKVNISPTVFLDKNDETSAQSAQCHTAVDNNNTILELEIKLTEKDNEINNLTKLAAKYERLLEKAYKFNEDLRNELSTLSSELHMYRSRSLQSKTCHTQVTEADIEQAYDSKAMPEWGTDSRQGFGALSIADCLKATAEAELQNQLKNATSCLQSESEKQISDADSEYVFDASSGLYYHSPTGYYWDPNFELFYDSTTGTYYKYNEKTEEYEIHSQVDMVTEQSQTISGNESNIEKVKSKGLKQKNRLRSGELPNRRVKRKLKQNRKSSDFTEEKHRKKVKIENVIINGNLDNEVSPALFEEKKELDNDGDEEGKVDQREKLKAEQSTVNKDSEDLIAETTEASESGSESSCSLATGESELESDPESGEISSESSLSDVEILGLEALPVLYESKTEVAEDYPPCIRVIVQSSEHLTCGSLYIITCTGGSIGRDKNKGHAIELEDFNVSKMHAEVAFDYEKHCYTLSDKGSQNGTILNGNKLSQNRSESDCCELHHEDLLQIGSTTFLLHIHKGHETCDSCEPGQVQAKIKAASVIKNNYVILSQEEKNKQRKKELKNIKKKYGLQNSHYEISGTVNTNADFCDKAYLRRKFVGSESEFCKQDVAPASVQSPISALNKGHKLLAKMGWKEGQGLGKTSSGIAEPINVELRINQSAGFGSATDVSLSLDNVQHTGKMKRWAQARKRYEKLRENNSETHTLVSSQVSSVNTVNVSDIRPHSKSLQVGSAGVDCGDFSAAVISGTQHKTSLSPLTSDPSSLPVAKNPLREVEHQTSQSIVPQYRNQMSWVKGGTEQVGLFVSPSSPSVDSTENT